MSSSEQATEASANTTFKHAAKETQEVKSHLFAISWLYLHLRSSSSVCAVFKAAKRKREETFIKTKTKTSILKLQL